MRNSPQVQAEARDRLGVIEKEEQSLKSAAYDKTKLTPLASDAHSPQVQAEARRKLDIIWTEQNSYEAAKNDIASLREFVAKPCKACLVQGDARRQLQILTRDAKIPKEQAEARHRADVIGEKTKIKRCRIEVRGTTYLNASPCVFTMSPDRRSFSISAGESPYFAHWHVVEAGRTAYGYWSGPKAASQTNGDLGILVCKGACWQNSTARICACKLECHLAE